MIPWKRKNGNPDDPLVECQIAGLFEVIADDNDEQATMARPSTFYDYEEYVFVDMDTMSAISAPYTASEGNGITSVDFFVSDAAKLESIVQEVQNNTSIDWNSYYITVNNEVYERISSSLGYQHFGYNTDCNDYRGKHGTDYPDPFHVYPSRKREIGILLAVGIEKYAVLLQQMLEICLVAIAAFPLAYLASREMAGTLGTLFGKAAENVIVTPQHFVLVTAAGAGLLIIAVLMSCIPVMRMKPKAILSQME